MPKIELQTQLIDPETDGPLTEKKADGSDLKLLMRVALLRALSVSVNSSGGPLSDDEKIRNYELWHRIKHTKGDIVEFTPEEIVVLRKCVMIYPTLLAGQVRALLG